MAIAAARPDSYEAPSQRSNHFDFAPIIRSDVINPSAAGEYSFDTETGDGIFRSESGAGSGPDGAVESQGTVEFTFPNGEEFKLSYVADAAGGYQPQSSWLPVAPAFPHPIPQFVLDQIAFAAREDAEAARTRDTDQKYYKQ